MKNLPAWALAVLVGALSGCGDMGCGGPQMTAGQGGGCNGLILNDSEPSAALQPFKCVQSCPAGYTQQPVEIDPKTGKGWIEAKGVCVKSAK